MSEVAENLAEVQASIDAAVASCGREAGSVTLMAVSKTWPVEHVQLAVDAGHKTFGENKVQEGEVKVPALPKDLEWHMIGHLQRNKVRKMLPIFDVVHSVDSLKLAKYMNNVAMDLELTTKIYLQVNIGEEEQKTGFRREELLECYAELEQLSCLKIQGLMCIPPAAQDAEETRPWFVATRELRDALEEKYKVSLAGLSMGMSSDYHVAIEEGSTIVRVGSSIFGKRHYKV